MLHRSPRILFFDESAQCEAPRVFGRRLDVPTHVFSDLLERYARPLCDQHQYVNTPMIGDCLEVTLQIAWSLHFLLRHYHILSHS